MSVLSASDDAMLVATTLSTAVGLSAATELACDCAGTLSALADDWFTGGRYATVMRVTTSKNTPKYEAIADPDIDP